MRIRREQLEVEIRTNEGVKKVMKQIRSKYCSDDYLYRKKKLHRLSIICV